MKDCANLRGGEGALFFLRRGHLMLARKDIKGAITSYERALKHDPRAADVHEANPNPNP